MKTNRSYMLAAAMALTFMLSACNPFQYTYEVDIKQGNIIDEQKVALLTPGMSKDEVFKILGSPVLSHAFNQQRVDYVYYLRKGRKITNYQRVTLIFANGQLEKIEK